MGQQNHGIIVLGRIGAPFGVKGSVHIHSYTEPSDNLLNYSEWLLKRKNIWESYQVLDIRKHGKGFVANLKGCGSREEAALLTNADIGIYREHLPLLPQNEFYWTDLIGLEVYTGAGEKLGVVDSLFETGSNDVLVVQGETKEYLIPYIPDEYVLKVDLIEKKIEVNWDPEF